MTCPVPPRLLEDGGRLEIDTQIPVIRDKLSLVAGIAGFVDELAPGNQSFFGSYALAARWKPGPSIEVIPFWSRIDLYNREAAPLYTPEGAFLPPRIERRRFPGPEWADQRNTVTELGTPRRTRSETAVPACTAQPARPLPSSGRTKGRWMCPPSTRSTPASSQRRSASA